MARPCLLTPQLQEAIVKRVAAGNYPEVAAVSAGIDRATFYRWKAQGRKEKSGKFRDFCDAIKRAEADAEILDITNIRKVAQGGQVTERRTVTRKDGSVEVMEKFAQPQWTASAWHAERKAPERWGKKEVAEISDLKKDLHEIRRLIHAD